ncbi:hypothetical protein DB88DRAFT_29014 [Papiliotrema laurentii]|uniref:Uncharacterized protein n=1 Tax=Papiliotrema laurentii TaxID=5418 RepID=A0AAD9L8N9_PAPLA|nr:hypothetical protein DB88DRAFT_29014 [Papiliotrema laurentii]
MGNCFSDPSSSTKHKQPSGGQKLGSAPNVPPAGPASSAQKLGSTSGKRNNDPPRTLGGGAAGTGGSDAEARERALLAAEERAMNAKKKGVNSANPKAGKLSAKLEADRKAPLSPKQTDERMMDRGQWN